MSSQAANGKYDPGSFSYPGFDWNAYVQYRPVYPSSFYSRIYEHHAAARQGNEFKIAHDEGAGAGIVSERLAEKFDRVIVSEPNAQYLDIARQRLSALEKFPKEKFSYLGDHAEKNSVPDGTVDVVTICEAIHWTDMYATVAEAARQLKSGGTFCTVWYPPPTITNNDSAQIIWHLIFSNLMDDIIKENTSATLLRALKYITNGFDSLGFPETTWETNVERWFTFCNGKSEGAMISATLEIELDEVRTGNADKRVFIEDGKDWTTEGCDFEWLRQCAVHFLPLMKSTGKEWDDLKDVLGDEKVKLVWPSVQIIATKK